MGELGIENRILSVLKQNVGDMDNELIKKSGVSRGTFYKYKRILQVKGLISK
jgi:ACT domain-containing protein